MKFSSATSLLYELASMMHVHINHGPNEDLHCHKIHLWDKVCKYGNTDFMLYLFEKQHICMQNLV